eukprot:GILK01006741.1.p1 GENE.GILK01006741.1~~GILK01006741.1.p1  ORF type:complete len:254 (+),score=25.07 GILK01006741.1:61-822(+)
MYAHPVPRAKPKATKMTLPKNNHETYTSSLHTNSTSASTTPFSKPSVYSNPESCGSSSVPVSSIHSPHSSMTRIPTMSSHTTSLTISPSSVKKRSRAPLSEQLARVGQEADALTNQLKQKNGLTSSPSSSSSSSFFSPSSSTILELPCRDFVVGKTRSNFPCTVKFFSDRVVYVFQHPTQKRIDMEMYYRDMEDVKCSDKLRTWRFRIGRDLEFFASDYDWRNSLHCLSLRFDSSCSLLEIRSKICPLIRSCS